MNKLAEMTGLSLTMLSHIERGMRRPTLDTFLRIAVALKVDLGVLINTAQASVDKGVTCCLSTQASGEIHCTDSLGDSTKESCARGCFFV